MNNIIKVFSVLVAALIINPIMQVGAEDVFDEIVEDEYRRSKKKVNINLDKKINKEVLGEELNLLEVDSREDDDLFNWDLEETIRKEKDNSIREEVETLRNEIVKERAEEFENFNKSIITVPLSELYTEPARMAWAMISEYVDNYFKVRPLLDLNLQEVKEDLEMSQMWVERIDNEKDKENMEIIYKNFEKIFIGDLILVSDSIVSDLKENKISIKVNTDNKEWMYYIDYTQPFPTYKDIEEEGEISIRREKALSNYLIRVVSTLEEMDQPIDKGYLYREFEKYSNVPVELYELEEYVTDKDIYYDELHIKLLKAMGFSILLVTIAPNGDPKSITTRMWFKEFRKLNKENRSEVICQDVEKSI